MQLAIRGDEELDSLIRATIAGGGVLPYIHKSRTYFMAFLTCSHQDAWQEEELVVGVKYMYLTIFFLLIRVVVVF